MDQLDIPGRTRYPSDLSEHGDSRVVDRQIARTLLRLDGHLHSRHVSTHSSTTSNTSFQRDTTGFVQKYNELAGRYGLDKLNVLSEYGRVQHQQCQHRHFSDKSPDFVGRAAPLEPTKSATASKRGIWRRLVRSSSSHQLTEPRLLVHKNSFNNLLGKQPKLALKCQSLDDFYKYGGTSVLNLPAPYRAYSLSIPTCIAASGNYLLQHGQNSGGIFRIPGQNSIVQALYHYYVAQMQAAQNAHEQVHASIGSTSLPVDISCSIPDVASVFKKFLWDLPGGIFGSVDLFHALHSVQSNQDCTIVKPRLCALALLSLMSTRRIAIISAVLGLLAFLKQDLEGIQGSPNTPNRIFTSETMSSKAISLIFAPIVLGNLTDHIEVRDKKPADVVLGQSANSITPRRGFKNAFRTPKHRKSASTDQITEIQASVERNNAAVAILEMMLRSWEEIASYMRSSETRMGLDRSSKSSSNYMVHLPPLRQGSVFDGHQSRDVSNGSAPGHLKIPKLGRSVSLRSVAYREHSVPLEKPLGIAGQDLRDSEHVQHAKATPGSLQAELQYSDGIIQDIENTPWWSGRLSHSFRSKVKSSVARGNAARAASESTTLFNPHADEKNTIVQSLEKSSNPGKIRLEVNDQEGKEDHQQGKGHFAVDGQSGTSNSPYNKSRKTSDRSSEGLADSGIDLSCRSSGFSGSELASRTTSVPEYLVAAPTILQSSSGSHRPSIIETNSAIADPRTFSGCSPDRSGGSTTPKIERVHSVRRLAQEVDNDTARHSVKISPSLIPRPVALVAQIHSSGSGSPRSKNRDSAQRRLGSRIPRTSTARSRGSNHRMSNRLQPMYPRPFLGEEDPREAVVRSEPIPRSINHSSGLSGEPVARQLHFERSNGQFKSDRMAHDSISWQGRQTLQYRSSTNVGTLYAEIRVLNDKLAGIRRECAEWRSRAQWAEAALHGQSSRGHQQELVQY